MGEDATEVVRIVHGAVCAVSWGVLIPLLIRWSGFITRLQIGGRQAKCFYAVKAIAYLLAFSGGVLGIWLAADDGGISHKSHFSIAIALFALGTLEAIGFQCYCCMPLDGVGWTVLVLGIVNTFKGFSILKPPGEYKTSYIVVISVGLTVAFVAEVLLCVLAPTKSGYFDRTQQQSIGFNNRFDF